MVPGAPLALAVLLYDFSMNNANCFTDCKSDVALCGKGSPRSSSGICSPVGYMIGLPYFLRGTVVTLRRFPKMPGLYSLPAPPAKMPLVSSCTSFISFLTSSLWTSCLRSASL